MELPGIPGKTAFGSRGVPEAAGGNGDRRRLREACRDFEAIFLREILKGMRRTVPGTGSREQALYRSLLDEQMARICAERGTGLAELLFSELSAMAPPRSGTDAAKGFHGSTDTETVDRYGGTHE